MLGRDGLSPLGDDTRLSSPAGCAPSPPISPAVIAHWPPLVPAGELPLATRPRRMARYPPPCRRPGLLACMVMGVAPLGDRRKEVAQVATPESVSQSAARLVRQPLINPYRLRNDRQEATDATHPQRTTRVPAGGAAHRVLATTRSLRRGDLARGGGTPPGNRLTTFSPATEPRPATCPHTRDRHHRGVQHHPSEPISNPVWKTTLSRASTCHDRFQHAP